MQTRFLLHTSCFLKDIHAVGIVSRLRGGQPRFDSRQEQRFFSFIGVHTGTWVHPALLSPGIFLLRSLSNGDVNLSTHLYLVCRLRMCGAIHSLPIRLLRWRLIKAHSQFTSVFTSVSFPFRMKVRDYV